MTKKLLLSKPDGRTLSLDRRGPNPSPHNSKKEVESKNEESSPVVNSDQPSRTRPHQRFRNIFLYAGMPIMAILCFGLGYFFSTPEASRNADQSKIKGGSDSNQLSKIMEELEKSKNEIISLRIKLEQRDLEIQAPTKTQPIEQARQHLDRSVLPDTPRDLSAAAVTCSRVSDCREVMLNAAHPMDEVSLTIASTRIERFGQPARGDRKRARELNRLALGYLETGKTLVALDYIKLAADSDPGDIEVQSNFALIAVQAKKITDAETAIDQALLLSPRRTSTWIAVTDYYILRQDIDKARRSAILAYEFSSDKTKTTEFFRLQVSRDRSELEKKVYSYVLSKYD